MQAEWTRNLLYGGMPGPALCRQPGAAETEGKGREGYCGRPARATHRRIASIRSKALRRLLEIGDELREILDVGFGQRARDARHVARVVGPLPCLERRQLLLDVGVVLAGDTGNLVLS